MNGQEYIQRQINLVKQQIKGSKVKFIVTDAVTKFKKLQYDLYENELQTLESIEKSLKALEIIKKKNVNMFGFKRDIKQLGNRFTYKYYQSNLGNYHSGFEIQELTEEEFELLRSVLE